MSDKSGIGIVQRLKRWLSGAVSACRMFWWGLCNDDLNVLVKEVQNCADCRHGESELCDKHEAAIEKLAKSGEVQYHD